MGRLRYGMLVSLDGYARDAQGSFDWATPDKALHAYVNDREGDIRTYVFGRSMWENMRYWENPPAADLMAYAMPHVAGGGLKWLPGGLTAGLVLREERAFGSGAVALTSHLTRSGS